ncbi:MAG: hypothetical protein JWL89_15 [Candidatus Saccharibacteria bacterium]|nr:hypothetical protein [Candidatus Saccharibacteria bacterium]
MGFKVTPTILANEVPQASQLPAEAIQAAGHIAVTGPESQAETVQVHVEQPKQ